MANQASVSIGFSSQEYWSRLPISYSESFPTRGSNAISLPLAIFTLEIEPASLASAADDRQILYQPLPPGSQRKASPTKDQAMPPAVEARSLNPPGKSQGMGFEQDPDLMLTAC